MAKKNSADVGWYAYDAFGRRVARTTFSGSTVTTHYVFAPDGKLLAEHDDATGNVIKEYVWLDEMVVAMIDSSSGSPVTYFVHTGAMDEPLVLTDASKAKVWDAYVDPYGDAQTFGTPTATINLRLPGQYYQAETGLLQNWMRDYDPSLGRYIQVDPIGLAGGQNVYPYVDGRPTQLVDPDGRMPTIVAGALIGAGIGGGFEAFNQAMLHGSNFNEWNWKAVAISTGSGAVTGALMTTPLGYTRLGVIGIGALGDPPALMCVFRRPNRRNTTSPYQTS